MPVLLDKVIENLELVPGYNAIDCTLGDAGHAEKILEMTSPNGRLLGIDADPESLLRAKQYLYGFGSRVEFVRDNFTRLAEIMESAKFGPVHGIIMDLGWSTPQFEERGRGFSFLREEPLDMRYGTFEGQTNQTAAEILQELSAEDLARIFKEFGEEKFCEEIAFAIVDARKREAIEKTGQLVEIILMVYRNKLKTQKEIPWIGGLHPATKVFQALRVAVNKELEALELALPQAVDALETGGRLAIITFHSLEDRLVKHFFKSKDKRTLNILTKKPIVASSEERMANPRAGSAKLRVAQKI